MKIKSEAFEDGGFIPSKYTCDGENVIPPLLFSDIPGKAKSLVLIMDDPDSPTGTWNHWTVWNIDPKIVGIPEGMVPEGVMEGKTTFGDIGYGGPCPGNGRHRYFFKLYALNTELKLLAGSPKETLIESMMGNIIAEAEMFAFYERKKQS